MLWGTGEITQRTIAYAFKFKYVFSLLKLGMWVRSTFLFQVDNFKKTGVSILSVQRYIILLLFTTWYFLFSFTFFTGHC